MEGAPFGKECKRALKETTDMYLKHGFSGKINGEKVEETKKCLEGLLSSQLFFAVIRPAANMK